MDERKRLIEKIRKNGWPDNEVVVSLEEFFEGNPEEFCNISVNVYPECPTTEEFYKTMLSIRNLEEVQDILIRIVDDIDEEYDDDWFSSDTVFIITKFSIEKIKELTKHLNPDEIEYGWGNDEWTSIPINAPVLDNNNKVLSLLWD